MSETSDQMERLMQGLSDKVLGELKKRVEPLVDRAWAEIRQKIESHADSLREKNAHRVIDGPSGLFLHTCSILLAGYRVILPLIKDQDKVLNIRGEAMSDRLREGIEAYLVDRFDITQDAPDRAFEKAKSNFKGIGEVRFGRAYVYEQENQDEARYSVHVRKCFFNEFFSENEAPEMTQHVFCIQDDIWMDELNNPKYGLKVSRSSIIAEGDDACSFHFSKTTPES